MRLLLHIGKLAAFVLAFGLFTTVGAGDAEAQYKNGQIGFEGGYMFLGEDTGLDSHGFLLGLRAAYKASDHWWFTAKGGVSFRGEQGRSQRTVVLLHVVPVDARYYFLTDKVRPYLGVTNSFQFLFNTGVVQSSVFWGPGVTGGVEFRVARDIFIGLEADAYWMFVFEGPDAPLITTSAQLIFFL